MSAGVETATVQTVVQKLASARLVTTDERGEQDTVTLAHERLIEAWPWLQRLVAENRDSIALQSQINEETTREARKAGKGFRLLVVNTTKRDDAISAKAKVYTYFPELKAYLLYQSPYYKLKVGNFKERKEAEDYQKKMKRYFPSGVFIMNDIIEMKPEKDKSEEI